MRQSKSSLMGLMSRLGLVLLVPAAVSCTLLGKEEPVPLTRALLDRSLALARQHVLNRQDPRGNFVYQYHFVAGRIGPFDHDVRQAGTLWSLALLHRENPSEETGRPIAQGLAFFKANSALTRDGRRYLIYPRVARGKTGTVAMVGLALVDFLRADPDLPGREQYERDLAEYIRFLLSLRMQDGRFHAEYELESGGGSGDPSPYFDGETLLLMVTAARYAGHPELKELALQSAERMYQAHVVQALAEEADSHITNGFYHWGSTAFYELYTSGWEGVDKYAGRVLKMADWMMDVHKPLSRKGNTICAHEGLSVAHEIARLTGRRDAMEKIERVINAGLSKLISWQVGGPIPNAYLRDHPSTNTLAVGGVMSSAANPVLRIDMTQHHIEALLLARRFVYRE